MPPSSGTTLVGPNGETQFFFDQDIPGALASGWSASGDTAVTSGVTGDRMVLDKESYADTAGLAGRVSSIDVADENALQAEQFGEEYYSGIGQGVAAGAEGAASALTFGLSDVALEAAGADTSERAHFRPGSRAIGEVAGTVATLAAGGTGALGKLLAKTPAGAVSALANRASEGASLAKYLAVQGAEGLAYGVGSGISQVALQDSEFSAEAALADVGFAGLAGGAFGVAGGAITRGLGAAGRKLRSEAALAATRESAEAAARPVASAVSDLDAYAKELTAGVDKRATQALRAEVQATVDSTAATLARRIDDEVATLAAAGKPVTGVQSLRTELAESAAAYAKAGGLEGGDAAATKAYFNALKSAGAKYDVKVVLPKPANIVAELPSTVAARRGLIKAGKDAETAFGGRITEARVMKVMTSGDADLATKAVALNNYFTAAKAAAVTPEQVAKVEAMMAKIVPTEAAAGISKEAMLAALGIAELPDFEGPVDDFLKAAALVKLAGSGGRKLAGKGMLGDMATGAARGFTGSKAASMARGAMGSGLAGAARAFAGGTMQSALDIGQRLVGNTGAMKARLAGAVEMLATGTKVATRVAAGTTKYLNAMFDPDADDEHILDKAAAFKRLQGQVAAIAANPDAYQLRVHEELAPVRAHYPDVADELEMKAIALPMFIASKMPQDPGNMTRMGKSIWRPSDTAMKRTAEYIKGATDPVGTFEDAVNGNLSAQAAEAMRTVNPAAFRQIQTAIMDRMTDIAANTTRDQRIGISVMFDVPLDPSVVPKRIAFTQSMWAQQAAQAQQTAPRPSSGTSKPEPTTKAQSLQSE